MKKRWSAVVLSVFSLTTSFAYGDGGWTPGMEPDGWFSRLSAVCNDLWSYMF